MEKVLYKVAHCCRTSVSFSTSRRCTKCTSCTTSNGSTNCTASYVPKRFKSGSNHGPSTYSDQFQEVASKINHYHKLLKEREAHQRDFSKTLIHTFIFHFISFHVCFHVSITLATKAHSRSSSISFSFVC